MKSFITCIGLLWLIPACNNASTNSSQDGKIDSQDIQNPATLEKDAAEGKYPVMTFDITTHDFGTIDEGAKVEYSFKFTNTGNADLIITNANSTCGCTIPSYPTKPIAPGASDYITVVFNSRGKRNNVHKEVTIIANTKPNTNFITITAFVNQAGK